MCLSSFFQFPLFIIACVEELETTNKTSSSTQPPQDMLNGSSTTKLLPSIPFLLGCLFLVLAIILPPPQAAAAAFPITKAIAAPHHRHTWPWAAWHRTTHVRRGDAPPITTGAELPDRIPFGDKDYAATASSTEISSTTHLPLRLPRPRDLLTRTYECWKGGKLWTCVMNMHVLKAGLSGDDDN